MWWWLSQRNNSRRLFPHRNFLNPVKQHPPQLTFFQTKLNLRNKVVNFHLRTWQKLQWDQFSGSFGENRNNNLTWLHTEEVREQNRKFPISHFVFTQSTWYYHLAFSVCSHVPECVHYLSVKWFDGDLYLPATFSICRVDIRKIQSNMFSLPFVVLLFPVVSREEKKNPVCEILDISKWNLFKHFLSVSCLPKAGRDCGRWLCCPQAVSHQLISVFVNRRKNTATVHRRPLGKYILHVNILFNTGRKSVSTF